jgi:subtilisin-like proprotein convertase family protein
MFREKNNWVSLMTIKMLGNLLACSIVFCVFCAEVFAQNRVVVVPLGDNSETSSYVMPTNAILVPPSGTGGFGTPPTISSITVPPTSTRVQDVNVIVDITHTFNSDLEVSLKHVPSDKTAELWTDIGGSGDNVRVVIDDDANLNISTVPAGSAIRGWFKPEIDGSLDIFRGVNAGGEWQLLVGDDAGGDTGILNSWVLQISN